MITDRDKQLAHKYNISFLQLSDEHYPALLKQIHIPPAHLWVRGDSRVLSQKSCALVGARNMNHYVHRFIRRELSALAQAGVVLVSGGARGVDTAVHEAALAGGGKTVAILGSGLLQPYPAENAYLFDRIVAQGGAVISPFPLEATPRKHYFPQRNRIIAGLSMATVVLQAAQKSGALITAQYALDENRTVATIPGAVDDSTMAGNLNLLDDGATMIRSGNDIADFIGVGELEQVAVGASEASWLVPYLTYPICFSELLQATGKSESMLRKELARLCLSGYIIQNSIGLWELR